MALISDRTTTVQPMIGNRTDLSARIPIWTANAYIELASNIPFPDLEATDVLSTVGSSGPQNFPPANDTYDYPTNAQGILSCTIIVQNVPYPVSKKNIEYIDQYPTLYPGRPVIWAPFNYHQIFRPVPDQSYQVIRRFWTRPVVDFTSTSTINATILSLPPDWLEIVDYTSALRGFMELKDYEKAQGIRIILYGDPKHPQDNPGLIKQRLTQIQSENMNSDYGMRMKIRKYTS